MWFLMYGVVLSISWIQIRGLWKQSHKRDAIFYSLTLSLALPLLVLTQSGISIPSPLDAISILYEPIHRLFQFQ